METFDNIRSGYGRAAEEYGKEFLSELDHKPFDRQWLEQFANLVAGSHRILDVGCGTGQTTGFLAELGVEVTGVDLCPEMLTVARRHFPELTFKTGNFFALDEANDSVDGIAVFYGIVHCNEEVLADVFREFWRVLKPGGYLILSFHAGEGTVHNENFLESGEALTFYYQRPDEVRRQLENQPFEIKQLEVRQPYQTEYPSQRGYVLAVKQSSPDLQ